MTSPFPGSVRALAALLLVVATAGCIRGFGRTPNPFNPSENAPGQLQILVQNQHFNDVTVYALRGGERIRLGNVNGKTDEQYTLRWDFTLGIEFEISLIGGGACATRELAVSAGDAIWVRVPPNLRSSYCEVGR